MNIDTGQIYLGSTTPPDERCIPIDINDATERQRSAMRVSLKDRRSKLGRKLTKARKANGAFGGKRRK